MRKSKNRYFHHIFVFPGDAPGAITLNVVWMEREFDAYKLSRCMCRSNYCRFWDTARYLWKNRHFIILPCIRRPTAAMALALSKRKSNDPRSCRVICCLRACSQWDVTLLQCLWDRTFSCRVPLTTGERWKNCQSIWSDDPVATNSVDFAEWSRRSDSDPCSSYQTTSSLRGN